MTDTWQRRWAPGLIFLHFVAALACARAPEPAASARDVSAQAPGGETGPGSTWPTPCPGGGFPQPEEGCSEAHWACNALQECACDPLIAGTHPGHAAEMAESATASSTSASRPTPAGPADLGSVTSERATAPGVGASEVGAEQPCSYLGVSPTAPQGGCPLAKWFCNQSALCRCKQ